MPSLDPEDSTREFQALQAVIAALQPLDGESRGRIVDTVSTFFSLGSPRFTATTRRDPPEVTSHEGAHAPYPSFSQDMTMSPKEFLFQKQPRTDVERIAVLAFYLTHYRDTPHFKTLDLSKLNTEAAQPKFANTANSAGNAVKQGYLVPSTKGNRQLSAAGERFVSALPDREEARAAMLAAQPRRKRRTGPVRSQTKPPQSTQSAGSQSEE